ncbi:hypothetical protein ABT115_10020 [Streptomyces sp. NPDC001832]|uniref:hypothetical protein n=1 Tax=Streptomyces sp. NPDC001832 TaxID=3154527 RepID=UPI00333208B0
MAGRLNCSADDACPAAALTDAASAPTPALLAEEAGERQADARTVVVDGAWGVSRPVTAGLAQASMADAVTRTATPIPVLSSPRPGLAAAAAAR